MARRTQKNTASPCIKLTLAEYAALEAVAAAHGTDAQGYATQVVLAAIWPEVEAMAVARAREKREAPA